MKKSKSYIRNISIAFVFFTAFKKLVDISFKAYRTIKKKEK